MTDGIHLCTSELPNRTTTVLSAAVEGDVAGAQPWLDLTVAHLAALYDGVLLRENNDQFSIAFGRAADAAACAWDLQRAPLDPVALRIAVRDLSNTG